MREALNYATDTNYTQFIQFLKSEIEKRGLSRPSTVVVDWLRLGGEEGFIISKEGQKKLYTITDTNEEKKINGAEIITISNDQKDQSNSLKEKLRKILCDDGDTLDFLGNYASQNGFLECSGSALARFFSEKNIFIGPKQKHWFEVLDNKIVLHTTVTVTVTAISSVERTSLEDPIEIETSIEILTGTNIADKDRLVNPKVEYLGPERKVKLARQLSEADSGRSSEANSDNENQLESLQPTTDSGIDGGPNSLQPIESSQNDTYGSSLFSQNTASGDQDLAVTSERLSDTDSDDASSTKSSEQADSGINSEDEKNSVISEVENDEESIIIDVMVLFHNDFKFLRHDKTTPQELKDAIDCFKELKKHFSLNNQKGNLSGFLEKMKVGTIGGLEVATLYYKDWKEQNPAESLTLVTHIEENDVQSRLEGALKKLTSEVRKKQKEQTSNKITSLIENQAKINDFTQLLIEITDYSLIQSDLKNETSDKQLKKVNQHLQKEVNIQTYQQLQNGVQNKDGLTSYLNEVTGKDEVDGSDSKLQPINTKELILKATKKKVERLQNLRFKSEIGLALSASVVILSSAICVTSVLEQAGKMSTNFLSVDKGFSANANIAILASTALLIIVSGLAIGFMLNRASTRTEEINKVEGKFLSKVLAEVATSMAR